MKNRAYRRHMTAVKKNKVRKRLRRRFKQIEEFLQPHSPRSEPSNAVVGKRAANHMADCSCAMCGNPRKFYKERTVQELKQDDNFKQQMGA